MSNREVTGGDLEDLWKIANNYLPTVEGAYNKQINRMDDLANERDELIYGSLITLWSDVANMHLTCLNKTSESLNTTAKLINTAIDEFKYVDGKNAGELTQAGADLEQYLDGEQPVRPTHLGGMYDGADPTGKADDE